MEASVRVPPSMLDDLEKLLGSDNVCTRPPELAHLVGNTLGVERRVLAEVRPGSTAEVQGVVEIANRHGLVLSPSSRGRNIGYGERAPIGHDQVLVNLSRMNRIRSFDELHGKVVIEPGVTQDQLYRFLRDRGGRFWMDVTGSTLDSSILGNTVEGGFGHTPVGDRRRLIAGVEMVLGDGTLLEGGRFPGLGPDLNGLAVQSNFGIVTAVEVTLLPAPEAYRSFIVGVADDAGLEPLVDTIRWLRQQGTMTSLVHIANATRTLMSAFGMPPEFRHRTVSCREAAQWLSMPLARAGWWSAIGGLYGSRRQVAAQQADIARAFRGKATVQFASDSMIRRAGRVLSWKPLAARRGLAKARLAVRALGYIHELGRGIPSDRGVAGVQWRVGRATDVGFFWCSPTYPATGEWARRAVVIAERLFARYDFELPITMSFVTPDRIVGTMGCTFDRSDAAQAECARTLYRQLKHEFGRHGIGQYRSSVVGMEEVSYRDPGKHEVLERLKDALDPNHVIAPGRYGIS